MDKPAGDRVQSPTHTPWGTYDGEVADDRIAASQAHQGGPDPWLVGQPYGDAVDHRPRVVITAPWY